MTKPLELTIHHKFKDRNGQDWYVWKDTAMRPDIADAYACNKHLTDAELAAEVFCTSRQLGEGHPAFNHWLKANREYARQAEIVERFATLPHADEHGYE